MDPMDDPMNVEPDGLESEVKDGPADPDAHTSSRITRVSRRKRTRLASSSFPSAPSPTAPSQWRASIPSAERTLRALSLGAAGRRSGARGAHDPSTPSRCLLHAAPSASVTGGAPRLLVCVPVLGAPILRCGILNRRGHGSLQGGRGAAEAPSGGAALVMSLPSTRRPWPCVWAHWRGSLHPAASVIPLRPPEVGRHAQEWSHGL
mmetsp:Transcript_17118/g.52902  ORF Transcript_17118/g.52902 Transcript_17118/m.52902 type:complete len:205 (+) Transcript_17118:119-733(+)